jgi:hypothetical protein
MTEPENEQPAPERKAAPSRRKVESLVADDGRDFMFTPSIKALASVLAGDISSRFPFSFDVIKAKKTERRETQLELLRDLSKAGIDPRLFDFMLSNELDRTLKKQFGTAFMAATVLFTLLSYGVIVFNSIERWGISDIAINTLIIETPIQFIGLLYIIARNLFPQTGAAGLRHSSPVRATRATPRPRKSADT